MKDQTLSIFLRKDPRTILTKICTVDVSSINPQPHDIPLQETKTSFLGCQLFNSGIYLKKNIYCKDPKWHKPWPLLIFHLSVLSSFKDIFMIFSNLSTYSLSYLVDSNLSDIFCTWMFAKLSSPQESQDSNDILFILQ